jgi:hypothetical protein
MRCLSLKKWLLDERFSLPLVILFLIDYFIQWKILSHQPSAVSISSIGDGRRAAGISSRPEE